MQQNFYVLQPGAALPEGGAATVGNKAWNLMRMAAAHLPVPPGFVLPTDWCRQLRTGAVEEAALPAVLAEGIAALEAATGRGFGAARLPLLVSVRSGAAVSMPGMMETVLNVGLNAQTVGGVIRQTGNPRLAWDSYRRLVQGYAEVVEGLPTEPFDARLRGAMAKADVESERDLDYRSLRELTRGYLAQFQTLTGRPFPQDPAEQLLHVASAVFRSWDAPKAASYRRLNRLDDDAGTAVTVQAMVFGNAGGASGAGVAFTRNPATGAPGLYLDFQFNGQGEDVVAGRHNLPDAERLRTSLPTVWSKLEQSAAALEALFKDAQDFEFTVQAGTLFLLQARNAKRTPWAALRIAADLVEEGLVTPQQALARLDGIDLATLVRTRFDAQQAAVVGHATVAGIGVAAGVVALDPAAVVRLGQDGTPVILVRPEASTADIEGMAQAAGILTAAGVRTSHAAVVARQLGKVCLVGCTDLVIEREKHCCRIGGALFPEGSFLSLDGNDGAIYAGRLPIVAERPERELALVARWREAAVAMP